MKSKEGDVISLRSWQAKPNNERQFIDRLIAYGRPSVLAQRTLARERTRRRFHRPSSRRAGGAYARRKVY